LQSRSADSYVPAEDTFFLADHIKDEKGTSALEIGTGSGYLSKILERNFELLISTDIDFHSLRTQDQKTQNGICCMGADALGAKFDLIVCNLPYLPSEKIIDRTVDGGPEGLEVPLGIIKSANLCLRPGGKMLYLTSSLANYEKLIKITESIGFEVKVLAKKKLFFEELIIVQATKLLS
jgi:release factor glutamine methyltransferase